MHGICPTLILVCESQDAMTGYVLRWHLGSHAPWTFAVHIPLDVQVMGDVFHPQMR